VVASELRFHVAGLEVALAITGGLAGMAGSYREYPARGIAPGLEMAIERIPGFASGRARGPAYPAFQAALTGPGIIALTRFDAEGQVTVPPDDETPVRAHFRVGESPNSLEAAIRVGMSIALPRLGGLILHASAIAANGQTLVFAGHSGAGKSTIATLLSGSGFARLADELLIVRPADGGSWHAHVAPFIGDHDLPHGTRMRLAGLHFLVQAPGHTRTRLPRTHALRELLRHVLVYVAEPLTAARVLAAADALAAAVPCHRLEFARDLGVTGVLGIT
jgi:hypothetical protein